MNIKRICFQPHEDKRGKLVSIDVGKDMPFCIKRIYYIYDAAPEVVRGRHAHRKLEQVLVCVHGKCKIKLDDGKEKETVLLDNPRVGIYVANNMWREIYDFSDDSVLMVFASEEFDESDYVRDYDEFIHSIK